jgi:hypothetical protein
MTLASKIHSLKNLKILSPKVDFTKILRILLLMFRGISLRERDKAENDLNEFSINNTVVYEKGVNDFVTTKQRS